MPFKSKAQRAYLYARRPSLAKEFEQATPKDAKLPRRVRRQRGNQMVRNRRTSRARRYDPSRTGLIRRAFAKAIRERFATVQRAVWQLVVKDDAFGLKPRQLFSWDVHTTNAPSFKFETDDRKLQSFNRWLKRQIDDGVLESHPSGEPKLDKPWLHKYIDSAYRRGLVRAYTDTHRRDLNKPSAFYEGSKSQFLHSAFAAPERVSKLKMIYTRTYEDLKGVTTTMASKMSRVLATGLANGDSPHKIGRELVRIVPRLTKGRAQTIALTEIIHAHAEGQLDGMEDLGVEAVGAEVEFATAGDDGVCPVCESMEGEIYKIDDARGVIPVHPRCRCAWLPVIR